MGKKNKNKKKILSKYYVESRKDSFKKSLLLTSFLSHYEEAFYDSLIN